MPHAEPREQQAPPVQRLRLRYAKRGRARFTSHRDFSRAFERALRRAGVPMAYSSGYSPHPRISYANAAPTGAASEAEYLEIGLVRVCDPEQVRAALDAALPPGLDVTAAVPAGPTPLADLLSGSSWRIDLTLSAVAPAEVAARACAALLAAETVEVERLTKTGMRRFDARAAVRRLAPLEPGGGGDVAEGSTALHLVLAHLVPLVRPDDVLSALTALTPDFAPVDPPVLHRLSQGVLDPDTAEIADPFAG
ncbi:radical SAM-linked protein [Friedmanniella endophytica]|uniref:Radical SAM-linked protein n=1 Tax=Microlunatus kandeliicorticis TaxID=1759536 RepID=A0A7W3P7C9_9ACTN|nr:TIGR03936 family radical SAM-associated protein [Microlunatus kandeliicorticis]MBA8795991.1 radical SAM-linked protein [Microlunatus kandeliicorticis]